MSDMSTYTAVLVRTPGATVGEGVPSVSFAARYYYRRVGSDEIGSEEYDIDF